jgi:magnesium chelatase family protein
MRQDLAKGALGTKAQPFMLVVTETGIHTLVDSTETRKGNVAVRVPLVDFRELSSKSATGDSSETIRSRVVQARRVQRERFRKSSNATNSAMSPRQMKAHCVLDEEGTGYLEHAMEEMNFSARAHDRILKVARTLADLSGSERIRANDVLEAIQYRSLDRKLFS